MSGRFHSPGSHMMAGGPSRMFGPPGGGNSSRPPWGFHPGRGSFPPPQRPGRSYWPGMPRGPGPGPGPEYFDRDKPSETHARFPRPHWEGGKMGAELQRSVPASPAPTTPTGCGQLGAESPGQVPDWAQPYLQAQPQRPPWQGNFNSPASYRGPGFKRRLDEPHCQKQSKKKQKVDSRDLPENNKFVCETCDRGFKTEEKYTEHVDGHAKCRVEGCQYVAAPKLVQLHYEHQHRTGLASKIWKLESKEDIAKWISERKKNFPTKANIEKKKAEMAEREVRGDVLENKYFGKMRGRGRGRFSRGQGRGRGRNHRHHGGQDYARGYGQGQDWDQGHKASQGENAAQGCQTADKESSGTSAPEENIALAAVPPASKSPPKEPALDPLSYVLTTTGDDEDNGSDEEEGAKQQPRLSGALGSLALSYGETASSSDQEDETPGEKETKSPATSQKTDCHDNSDSEDVCGNEVVERQMPAVTLNSSTDDAQKKSASEEERNCDSSHASEAEGASSVCVNAKQDSNLALKAGNKLEDVSRHHSKGHSRSAQHTKAVVQKTPPRGQHQHAYKRGPHISHVSKKRLTLLEKLLAPDIRHERNVILQCVRHIVNNNFFGRRAVNNNNGCKGRVRTDDSIVLLE